jgi:hypothetical protein
MPHGARRLSVFMKRSGARLRVVPDAVHPYILCIATH